LDAGAVWTDYDPVADELLVYFDRPRGSVSVAIGTPDRDYVYLLVDDVDDEATVVGVHVDDLRAWVAEANPRWAPLMDTDVKPAEREQAVSALIADAAGLFAVYGAGDRARVGP